MLQEITFQKTAPDWWSLMIESVKAWWLKRNTKRKENYFLIH
jgi:hypothetical protein